MATIFEELLVAAQAVEPTFPDRAVGEPEQDYMKRLLTAVAATPDEVWNKISPAAGDWFNTAVAEVNKNLPCPPCPGYQTDITEVEGGDKVVEVAKETEAPKEGPAVGAGSKRGIMIRMREVAILHPDWTEAQIADALKTEGWEKVNPDTAWVCREEVKNVLRAAGNLGYILVTAPDPAVVGETA